MINMKISFYLLNLFPLLIFIPYFSCAQGVDWAQQVELVNYSNVASILHLGQDVENDSNGNIYMAGNFAGTQKFGDTTLTSAGIESAGITVFSDDGFIAKYTAAGELIWVEAFPSELSGNVYDIELDSGGNIYALFHFLDSITLVGTQVIADEGFVVAKFSSDLSLMWYQPITRQGGQNFLFPGALELTADQVIITGEANDEVLLDGVTLNSDFPVIIVNLDKVTGELNWFKNLSFDTGDLATDANGNIYWSSTVSTILTPLEIGGVTINSSMGPVLVFAKLDVSGDFEWVKTVSNGTNNPVAIQQVDVEKKSGNIYAAGTWGDTLNIDGVQLVSSTLGTLGNLLWVAQFNSLGEIQWVKTSNIPPNVSGAMVGSSIQVSATADGGVFIAGEHALADFSIGAGANEVFFDNTVDGFVVKYASSGDLEWAQQLNCLEAGCKLYVRGLTALKNNEAVLTGSFSHIFELGDFTLTAVVPYAIAHPNIYLLKLNGDLIDDIPVVETQSIKIFPNPANAYLIIQMEEASFKNCQMEIMDMTGRIIYRDKITDNSNLFYTKTFPEGFYFLLISVNNYQVMKKFVLVR